MFRPTIIMGKMKEGSTCCTCDKDIGGEQGVQYGDNDYCLDCFEEFMWGE